MKNLYYVNKQYGLTLYIKSINDTRCPANANCFGTGNVSGRFHLENKKSKYDFTLDYFNNPPVHKNDTVIGGLKYLLTDVLPWPKESGDKSLKTVKILVEKVN